MGLLRLRGTAQTLSLGRSGPMCQVTRGPGTGPLALTSSVTYQNLPHRQLPRCLLLPTVPPKSGIGSLEVWRVGEQRVTADSPQVGGTFGAETALPRRINVALLHSDRLIATLIRPGASVNEPLQTSERCNGPLTRPGWGGSARRKARVSPAIPSLRGPRTAACSVPVSRRVLSGRRWPDPWPGRLR